jgi:hypothetical protein
LNPASHSTSTYLFVLSDSSSLVTLVLIVMAVMYVKDQLITAPVDALT